MVDIAGIEDVDNQLRSVRDGVLLKAQQNGKLIDASRVHWTTGACDCAGGEGWLLTAFNRNRVNYRTSLIGGIPQTQEIVDYCAENKIYPQIQVINSNEINEAWEKVLNKEARYRYVIDTATI